MEEPSVKVLDIQLFSLPEERREVVLSQSDDKIADVLTDAAANPSASQEHEEW